MRLPLLGLSIVSARPASAAHREAVATSPAADVAPDAANDAPANECAAPLPLCSLTDAQREHYHARAMALPVTEVRALPPYVDLRSTRQLQHVAAAWGERDRLVGIAVDGVPITAAELDDALPLVTWVRDQLARRALPEPAAPADDLDAAMAPIVLDVARVCDGLKLRHEGNRRMCAALSSIRAERRPTMLGGVVRQLLVLCVEPANAAALAALPKGEADAVARLRAALPAWEQRVATWQVDEVAPTETPQAMARRAWTLAETAMDRVVRAGRYLAKGDPAQERLWRAFRPAKKAAKTPDAPTPAPEG
jgi:hypothetical protein